MANLILLLLTALLALFCSVDAKDDQIRLYQFASDNCDGNPVGGNLDLKQDACVNINARSFKPRIDDKRKKWVDDINHGAVECMLVVYSTPNCPTQDQLASMMLPEQIDRCVTHASPSTVRSAKFVCGRFFHVGDKVTTTATKTHTSWSVGNDEKFTPYLSTQTLTVVSEAPTVPVRAPVAHRLEPRGKKGDIKYVWMFHPWSRSVLCYECYTNKPGNMNWVKCHSGPDVSELCTSRPVDADGRPFTTTTTQTSTSITSTRTTTTTDATSTLVTTALTTILQPRSWHKSVHFQHPWTGRRVCADAEWEKRGRPNFEIRLQDVHIDREGKDCEDSESIDVPDAIVATVMATTTVTETISEVAYTKFATSTVTMFVSISATTFFPNSILVSETPIPGISIEPLPNGRADAGYVAAAAAEGAAPTHTDL